MTPFFSIIIPTFNSANTIAVSLQSILNQTFINYEILIMDGVSSDNTLEIIKSYQDDRIRINSQYDEGIYDAMNKGIKLAKGKWIFFLGSDDVIYSNDVLTEIHNQTKLTSCKIIYGNVYIHGDSGWSVDKSVYDGKFNLNKIITKNICHQAIFYKEIVFRKIGLYNLSYSIWSDWDFNLRCFSKYKFKYVELIISDFKGGGVSSTIKDDNYLKNRWVNIGKYFWRSLHKNDMIEFLPLIRKNCKHNNNILLFLYTSILLRLSLKNVRY